MIKPCKEQRKIMEGLGFVRTNTAHKACIIWEIPLANETIIRRVFEKNEIPRYLTGSNGKQLLYNEIYETAQNDLRRDLTKLLGLPYNV